MMQPKATQEPAPQTLPGAEVVPDQQPPPQPPPASKPPETQPQPPPASAAPPPRSEVNVSAGEVNAERISISDTHREINYYFAEKHGLLAAAFKYFTFNQIWRVGAERREEISGLFVADSAEIEHLRRVLVEKRVLILSGESGLGKTTTAIHLASLVSADGCGADGAGSPETYLIPTLDRYVKIDLHEVCECDGEPRGRFVVFKDALARRNHDLVAFFTQLTQFSLGEFAEKLRQGNSYFVFTVTSSEAAQLQAGVADGGLRHELKHLSDELLLEGLGRRLAHLARCQQAAPERLKRLRDPAQQMVLIARLRTMPRIARFVDYYLSDFAADLEGDLDEAIRRCEDITYWFHRDLPADFEAWCFTLSLGLAHCLRDAQGVSWMDFENLRRAVWQCLKRDPELFPPRPGPNDNPLGELSEKTPTLTDDPYFEKGRAEVLRDPNGLADLIRFSDDSYPHKLWEILLKHHRRVLTTLLPRLVEMAEDHSGRHDPAQRALCARIIGRVGEIDPGRVTLAAMERWISSDDVRHRATIGALYQGILASRDERYRDYFLELLKSLSAPDRDAAGREEEKNRLLTAIAVYSQIGAYDLSLAMKGLEGIARDKLVPVMREGQRIERLIERTRNAFAQQSSEEEAIGILIYQEMLSDLAERLYAQQGSTFVGVLYAISSLALTTDPVSVFRELRRWMETSNRETGALVALMFLIKDGIVDTLESRQVEIADGESAAAARKTCNPIIVALTSGQEPVLELARFLVTIFESFSAKFIFPKEFVRFLRESFLLHLRMWVEEALPIESCRRAMESLFVELMRIHGEVLFEPIYQLLNSPDFTKKEPEIKKAFAAAVLWQRH